MAYKDYLESEFDHFRSAVMCEPRGHNDMVGAILLPPVSKEADLGIVFMDSNRWINMCGHATMGSAMVAVACGLVPMSEPITEVVFDTPAGRVSTRVAVNGGQIGSVTIVNVPSFLYLKDASVEIAGRTITLDVAYGGSFFALVDVESLETSLTGSDYPVPNLDEPTVAPIVALTKKIVDAVNKKYTIQHPVIDINGLANVEYFKKSSQVENTYKNIVVSREGQIDRSPCGTGTSAKLSSLVARNKIDAGSLFYNESFTGSHFTAVATDTVTVGPYQAIIPNVTGEAFILGESVFTIDDRDPLKYGFRLA